MKLIKVDFEKTVSLDVDAQNGFTPLCPEELPIKDGDKIASECNKNAEKAKFRYMSKDAHPYQSAWITCNNEMMIPVGLPNVDVSWPRHCVVGTFGFELIKDLPEPSEYDFIVYKGVEFNMHPYSAIYHDLAGKISTGIIEKAKFDGVDTFILGGLALDYCVGETAFHLKKAGFRVIINLSATKVIGNELEFIRKAETAGIEFVKNSNEIFSV